MDKEVKVKFGTYAKNKTRELGLSHLDTPIFIRFCREHSRYEWCDPFSERGGVASTLEILKGSLRELYRCYCGEYHVNYIYVLDNDKLIDFYQFVSS